MYSRSIRLAPPATSPPTPQRSGEGNLEPIEQIRLRVFKEQLLRHPTFKTFFTDAPATITSEWLDSLVELFKHLNEYYFLWTDEDIKRYLKQHIEKVSQKDLLLSKNDMKKVELILLYNMQQTLKLNTISIRTPVGW